MRIVAGRFRGRPLVAPTGGRVRPTSDRARETLFNILAHGDFALSGRPPLPEDARVLDLFAGSGALGLEALSRGARRVVFVDDHLDSRAAIRRNVEALGAMGETQILRRDATKLGDRPDPVGGPFDLVLLDPPYRLGLAGPALESARLGGWLAEGAVAVAELAADEPAPEPPGFVPLRHRRVGEAQLVFYRLLADA